MKEPRIYYRGSPLLRHPHVGVLFEEPMTSSILRASPYYWTSDLSRS